MSKIELIIEERAADIGKFLVGRILPFRRKRMVGPFIFIDHMGPVKLSERDHFDVLPHPHIGLSTLTFLFDGSIMHRDSIGSSVEIKPGEVNLMTAGRGIVHSERTPDHLRDTENFLHGLQIWIALPRHLEETEPAFHHAESHQIPRWEENGIRFALIAGEALGHRSPVPVHSPLYMLEIKSDQYRTIDLSGRLYGEYGIYILEGGIESEGHGFGPKHMLVAKDHDACAVTLKENTTLYIFGGEPFAEERFIDWNFVSSSKEKIEEAKQKWKDQAFDKIPGDDQEFVPYPTFRK
jgi:redox-sensitive bicupin YhaK (pirin superfamily)